MSISISPLQGDYSGVLLSPVELKGKLLGERKKVLERILGNNRNVLEALHYTYINTHIEQADYNYTQIMLTLSMYVCMY